MVTIAICDDVRKELEKTAELCSKFQAEHPEYELRTHTFLSAKEMNQFHIEQQQFDILLLDIYMPEMTGIELAELLRDRNENCQIIFLTTSLNHAVEAFSLHAVHYLVKPFTKEQLESALIRAIEVTEKQRKARIVLKSSEGVHRICFTDIIYIETEGHFQKIYQSQNKSLRIRITSKELYEMLSTDNRFYKCGSTYIINLDKVEEVTTRVIRFDNGWLLPMLRRQHRELTERYTRYALGGVWE